MSPRISRRAALALGGAALAAAGLARPARQPLPRPADPHAGPLGARRHHGRADARACDAASAHRPAGGGGEQVRRRRHPRPPGAAERAPGRLRAGADADQRLPLPAMSHRRPSTRWRTSPGSSTSPATCSAWWCAPTRPGRPSRSSSTTRRPTRARSTTARRASAPRSTSPWSRSPSSAASTGRTCPSAASPTTCRPCSAARSTRWPTAPAGRSWCRTASSACCHLGRGAREALPGGADAARDRHRHRLRLPLRHRRAEGHGPRPGARPARRLQGGALRPRHVAVLDRYDMPVMYKDRADYAAFARQQRGGGGDDPQLGLRAPVAARQRGLRGGAGPPRGAQPRRRAMPGAAWNRPRKAGQEEKP